MNIKMVDVDSINFDYAYQRPLNAGFVNALAKAFQTGAIKAVSLSSRPDGSLWCYDGQHTVAACRIAGIRSIAATVIKANQQKEAELFLLINGKSHRASQREFQTAGVVAKEEAAIIAGRVLDKFGIEISKGGNIAGKTSAIGAIRRFGLANEERLNKAVELLKTLWGEQNECYSGLMIRLAWEVVGAGELYAKKIMDAVKKKKITARRVLDYSAALQSATGTSGGGAAYLKRALSELTGVIE